MGDLKNIIVGQSGGPTAVINGSLYGVASAAIDFVQKGFIGKVYGMVNGIEGFLSGNTVDMTDFKADGTLDLIRTTPGSYLGSCRFKLPSDLDDPTYDRLFEKFAEFGIGYFFYIGGNDSMDTVSKLSRAAELRASDIHFMGVPKTIDNDLIMTDHTPGFGSAAKYIASSLLEIIRDAVVYDNKKSVTIVEIMGRDAGWLTASSVLARTPENHNPLLIYLPESNFDLKDFIARLNKLLETENNIIVCISEGIHDADDKLICEYDSDVGLDAFGHKMLTGSGKYLEKVVKNELGVKVRSIELNVLQRCSSAMLSATDLDEAARAGSKAVEFSLMGETGKMVAFLRPDNASYSIVYAPVDVNLVCNQVKHVPDEWIIDGCDIADEFIEYAMPLIQGEVEVPHENGLPKFAVR